MIGLARHLPPSYRSVFLSFPERGLCRPFLDEARRHGFESAALEHNAPQYRLAVRELVAYLRISRTDILCCHGYKPDVLGWLAGRRIGIPVIAIAHGWTGSTAKVRLNERLDRLVLRGMDRVVAVSAGQADKVQRAGVPARRIIVIHDAVQVDRFDDPDPEVRGWLTGLFPDPPRLIVGAAGRLSPEKGFHLLVDAARRNAARFPAVGYVLFGDGALREDLACRINAAGLAGRFLLAGFRNDLDRILPHLDILALPSYTEGLPNIVLEANAARIAVVATAVGGTPEAIMDGHTGYLVPPDDPVTLARRIGELLDDADKRQAMGRRGRERVEAHFNFLGQSQQYASLFDELAHPSTPLVPALR